jgi:hypothetical protein
MRGVEAWIVVRGMQLEKLKVGKEVRSGIVNRVAMMNERSGKRVNRCVAWKPRTSALLPATKYVI